jgi:chromosome segregation ATPase
MKNKEAEVVQLTNELNIFKLKVEDLEERNVFGENETVILKDRIRELENDLETLNSTVLERDSEVLVLKDKLIEKNEENAMLNDRLKDIESDLERLNTTVYERDSEILLLKYKIDEKEEELIKKINKIKEEYANNQGGNIVESMDSVIQNISTISDTVDEVPLNDLESEVKELVVKAKKGRKKKGEN